MLNLTSYDLGTESSPFQLKDEKNAIGEKHRSLIWNFCYMFVLGECADLDHFKSLLVYNEKRMLVSYLMVDSELHVFCSIRE